LHGRYPNIEIAYLLQKMDAFEGLTVHTTNMLDNLDDTDGISLRRPWS
jgi:hypothetical protein